MKKYRQSLKRSTGLLPFLLVLLLVACHSKQNAQEGATAKDTQFRVATYNIRYDAEADYKTGNGWDTRKGELADLIKRYDFEIFGTQEGDKNQMNQLKGLLPGYDYVAHPYGGKGDLHNCAIVYKADLFDVLDSGVFWLSETPDVPSVGWDATDRRICQWAKLKVKKNDQVFYFFNAHFYWRLQDAKRESGPLMVQQIKRIAGSSPIICTGDFNSTAETSQIQAMKRILNDSYEQSKNGRKGNERTAFPGGVFQGQPKSRIDYIFVSKFMQVKDYEVYADRYNTDHYPSDHLPVSCVVSF